jgi:hypothetical protein
VQLISVKFQGRNRQSNSNRRKVGEGGNDAGLILISFRKFTTGMVDWHFIDSCCPPLLWYSEGSFFQYRTENKLNAHYHEFMIEKRMSPRPLPLFSARYSAWSLSCILLVGRHFAGDADI